MQPQPAVFAIPGDITRKTGGYIYERNLLFALRDAGREVEHLVLPDSFPHPSTADTEITRRQLCAIPANRPLILDGLVFGGLDTECLAALRCPVVAMIHHPVGLETGLSPDRARALIRQETKNLDHAAHVVVPSPHTAMVLQEKFRVPAQRISIALPGFVRTPTNGANTMRPKGWPPLILSVGLLAARKGHDVLIAALSQITDLTWRAEIVGGTHDTAVARALSAQLANLPELSGRLTIAGLVTDEALQARFRAASIFALATRYEGYGIVFGEALCHGLPIIATTAGAVPDTVPSNAGILVPTDDPAAFADALRRVLEDGDLRIALARNAACAGANLPSWADCAAVMGNVLDRVAVRKKTPDHSGSME